MPTFDVTPGSWPTATKLARSSPEQLPRFEKVVREVFVPDLETGRFRPSLRVKGVQGHPSIYEMTWAPDGRATWEYGQEQIPGKAHVIWRRLGTHAIFDPGPP